jgi:hypothetical protein
MAEPRRASKGGILHPRSFSVLSAGFFHVSHIKALPQPASKPTLGGASFTRGRSGTDLVV